MRQCLKTKVRFLTLMEVMIAMAIILSLVGIVGFNVRGVWREQKYRSEVDRILSQLRFSQDMVLLLNIESEIDFSEGKIQWFPVGNINRFYERMLNKSAFKPTQIEKIEFETTLEDKTRQSGNSDSFKLNFLDRGFQMSRGVLKIIPYQGQERYIFLKGYPAPIEVQDTPVDLAQATQEDQTFREKLTQVTWSNPDVRKKKKTSTVQPSTQNPPPEDVQAK